MFDVYSLVISLQLHKPSDQLWEDRRDFPESQASLEDA